MSGFGPNDGDVRGDGDGFAVGDGLKSGQDGFDILCGVEGCLIGVPFSSVPFVLTFGIAGLHSGGIAKDECGELDGGRGGEDGALEVGLREQGKSADVVEVCVGDDDGVWDSVREPSHVAVEFICAGATLEEAAIHEEASGRMLHEVTGAGDFSACGAERGDGQHDSGGIECLLGVREAIFAADGT